MKNNQFVAVVGKVVNGRVYTMVARENGTVVGHVSPIKRDNVYVDVDGDVIETRVVEAHEVPVEIRKAAMAGTQTPLAQKLQELAEPVDSPFIKMCNENHKRHVEEREARLAQIAKENKRRNSLINKVARVLKGDK